MKILRKYFILIFIPSASFLLLTGCSAGVQSTDTETDYSWLNLDTITAGKFDTGKMWTFEYPPVEYFKEEYGFSPSEEWLENVRLAALRFATYCSASFVSEDGLIMTNDHCARESVVGVQQEGENLNETGFIAGTLEDERKVPDLFVDQLVSIQDVTEEVQAAVEKGKNEFEKLANEQEIISEIENRESEATGLMMSVVPLFNGGRYSLYGYKRYNDVRLVFSPESQIGFFGGDPDNFTYPRYNLDCSFFRVYDEDGKPLKTDNYFRWSENGPSEGEPVFVVGNPGSTNRLLTVAQLEYLRDIQYPRTIDLLGEFIRTYEVMMEENPEQKDELEVKKLSYANSLKAYTGMLEGLRDPVLMQRKKDFENNFMNKVSADPEINSRYGGLWDKMGKNQAKLKRISNELYFLSLNPLRTSEYFFIAQNLVVLAEELKLPSAKRSEYYKGEELENTIESIIPEDIDTVYSNELLKLQIATMTKYLGNNSLVQNFTGGKRDEAAFDYIISKTIINSPEKVRNLIGKGPDAILNSDDPFITFIRDSEKRRNEIQVDAAELQAEEETYNRELGRALYEVFGTSIPPDATFTLRLADGIVSGFPYNGTIAPEITTFYGLYERYYSFNKEFPWNLPERWENPPAEFDLETPFNFVATNDIIGGNSGSPVINKNGEVVGLAFDGNIQSLPGNFIYTTEENRMVAVHSTGMIEAIRDLYKAVRLSDELSGGRLASTEMEKEEAEAN